MEDMSASVPLFTICTIANDLNQYRAMRETFIQSGFDLDRCEYLLYDNSAGNRHDPFEVLSVVQVEFPDRNIIVCHQDIRIDRGAGREQLQQRLSELSRIDPIWAVAGNYGVTSDLRGTGKVHDPNETSHPGPLPEQVVSLDENFLVLRAGSDNTCTPGLKGFHLYGTDICMNAMVRGKACYVIDFPLSHLSGGNTAHQSFGQAVASLSEAWNDSFAVAVVGTPNVTIKISRWKFIRRLLRSTKVCRIVIALGINFITYPQLKCAWTSRMIRVRKA